jgi:hypothetical protein
MRFGKLKTNGIFLLLLIAIGFLVLCVETVTDTGFFSRHFFATSNQIIYVILLLTIFYLVLSKDKFYEKVTKPLACAIIGFLLTYIILNVLEIRNYPNYVFSAFHLNLMGFQPLLVFVITLYFLIQVSLYLNKHLTSSLQKFVVLTLFSLFLYTNSGRDLVIVKKYFAYAAAYPEASYGQKMYELWGEPYNFFKIGRTLMDKGSILIIPPQESPYDISGNKGLVRYFLNLVNLDQINPLSAKKGDFIIITPGNELNNGVYKIWPEGEVSADYYFVINAKDASYQKISGDYNSSTFPQGEWGLIHKQ